jgi:putative addiction module antidote
LPGLFFLLHAPDYYGYRYGGAIMPALKLKAVGTSTGVVLPKEMLIRMRVEKGDTLFAIETPDGYMLTPYDPEINEQLEAGRGVMKQYRETFKKLAE